MNEIPNGNASYGHVRATEVLSVYLEQFSQDSVLSRFDVNKLDTLRCTQSLCQQIRVAYR